MKKNILLLLTILSQVLMYGTALAEEAGIESGPDLTPFQHMTTVPANDFLVPTVIEVPFSDRVVTKPLFLVLDADSRVPVASYWHFVSTEQPVKVSATRDNGVPARRLVDKLMTSSEVFDLPDTGFGSTDIYLSLEQARAISSLTFSFEKNVELPTSISIETLGNESTRRIVLAETNMMSNFVSFPVVTTNNLKVKLTYSQPLRISEITLGEDNKTVKRTSGLRFLAQPKSSYLIYLNPDRSVSSVTSAGSNLRNDAGVVVVDNNPIVKNPLFKSADIDDDGVIDLEDNCREISNPTQTDTDKNGVGDECDDYDRDGLVNSVDNCPNLGNPNQNDEDSDGIGDVCDDEESRFTEKYYWILWVGLGIGFIVLGALFWIVLRRDPNLMIEQQ